MSFDDKAKEWDSNRNKVERAEVLARIISEFIKGKDLNKALEFGCGTGLVSFFLKDKFSEVILVDTSQGMIEVVKDKIAAANTSHFTPLLLADKMNFEYNSFDIIYSLMAMHHVKDLDAAFSEFSELLKPGGYLCIADLEKESGDFHNAEESKKVHHGFNHDELVQKLKVYGFSKVDYQVFFNIERMVESGDVKKFPLFLLIMEKT